MVIRIDSEEDDESLEFDVNVGDGGVYLRLNKGEEDEEVGSIVVPFVELLAAVDALKVLMSTK